MFSRVVQFTGATDIDAGVRYLNDTVAPLLRQQKGFRGAIASADRAGRVFGALTLWATEAERDASDTTLVPIREEGQRIIGGAVTVENYEEIVNETARPTAPGCALLLRRITVDPAKIEEILDYFTREVLPQMKAAAGFCAVRNMINRHTGEGRVGTVWTDRASMQAWEELGEQLRQQSGQRGVSFTERSEREIIWAELR